MIKFKPGDSRHNSRRPLPQIHKVLLVGSCVTDTQLTNFLSSQSITRQQAQQRIITLTRQICAIALYDGQPRNGLILSSAVLNQATDAGFTTQNQSMLTTGRGIFRFPGKLELSYKQPLITFCTNYELNPS